jgi:sodium pump decarboxylase gamma subunit
MDTEALKEGSLLIVVGMLVVFVALFILVVAIMIMNRLFPEKAKKAEEPAVLEAVETDGSERERIAALAVAVAKAMEKENEYALGRGVVGQVVWSGEASRWAASGREQVMRSRGKAGRQWGRPSD